MKQHAQWWRSDMKDKICTQTRKDSGASFLTDGWGPALSARVAEECNRISGQKMAEAEERAHTDLARKAIERE